MKKAVVDASVAVKWFIPEVHSAAAVRFLDEEIALLAPDLLVPEFASILWKKVRRKEITRADANEILSAFEAIPFEIRPSSPLLQAAFELAVDLDRTVYDCLYLSLALAEECALITADAKLHGTIAGSAFAGHVRWVEDEV